MSRTDGSSALPASDGRLSQIRDFQRDRWRRMLMAGMVITITLGMSSWHAFKLSPGLAAGDKHPIQATALIRPTRSVNCGLGCIQGGLITSPHLHANDVRQWPLGDLGQVSGSVVDALPSLTDAVAGHWIDLSAPFGAVCRSAKRWNGRSHVMSSQAPIKPARHGIHLLASRRWATEETTGRKTLNCTPATFRRPASRLDAALSYTWTEADKLFQPRGRAPTSKIDGWVPGRTLKPGPALSCGFRINRWTPKPPVVEQCCTADVGSGGEIGSADRGSLPGRSTRYRVIWLKCPQCGAAMACLFYDDGDTPLCVNPLHGPLEVLR
jgi:hypothetical protein